jgi:hypothetical protein
VKVKRELEGKKAVNQVDREPIDLENIVAYSSSR